MNLKSSKEDSVVWLFFEDTKDIIKEIQIDGKKLPIYEMISLQFVALTEEGIDIKFILSKNNNLDIRVVEQTFGFPTEFQGKYNERPDNITVEAFDTSDSTFSSMFVSY